MSLVKELKNKANSQRARMNADSAITEAQRLIADKGAEDYNILCEMGMHKSVQKAQNDHGIKLELEELDKKYGEVYSVDEIKAIACRYALKFRRSDTYEGIVDPAMLQHIKQFFKDSGIEINGTTYGKKFFILAPPKTFKLEERPRPEPKDPILFYKLDDRNYRLIFKWGEDLTFFRKVIGWKYRNVLNYWLTWLAVCMIPALLLAGIALKVNIDGWWIASTLFGIAALVISLVRTLNDEWGGRMMTWAQNEHINSEGREMPFWMNASKAKF